MLQRFLAVSQTLLKESYKLQHCVKYAHTQNVFTALTERGIVQKIFPDAADKRVTELFQTKQTVYAGFDPTADSLHIGNLLVIIGLLHLQRAGHTPIALLGGATALIGDPSGRTAARDRLKQTEITHNLKCIEEQLSLIFQNHHEFLCQQNKQAQIPRNLLIVNNADWYAKHNLVHFIYNYGHHFRMGQMLSRTSVKSRLELEAGMSFTEFTYQVFQAFDWLHLLESRNCQFQMGGSDQLGNLMSGHELISRASSKKEVYGLTLPIVTNEEGDKFGKSAGNAVWLNSQKTSPFKFYQFLIRTTDNDVEKLLKLFTFKALREIKLIMLEHQRNPAERFAQKELAKEVTLLVHGEKGLKQAERVTKALYAGSGESFGKLQHEEVKQIFEGASLVDIVPDAGMTVLELAMKSRCFPTEQDAIRIIQAGGLYVNQKRVQNIAEMVSDGIHVLQNGLTILRVGKRNFYIVRWRNTAASRLQN